MTDVKRLFSETKDHFDRIDVVVSNAGIMANGPIAESQIDAFDKTIATNLRGTYLVLANELRGRRITVNAVAPGPVATDLFLDGKSDELIETLANTAPLERLGQPEDIVRTVAFLAGEQGGWINVQVIRANGGFA